LKAVLLLCARVASALVIAGGLAALGMAAGEARADGPPLPDSLAAPAMPGTAVPAGPDSAGAGAARGRYAPPFPGFAPLPRAPDSVAAAVSPVRAPGPAGPIDYLWVLRTALQSPASIESTLHRARAMRVRGLLVQVVGRGDAWYRSDLLPRPEALPPDPLFDPLGELLRGARAAGVEVHAWINTCLVWSAPHRPHDPRHVVRAHPEWIARLRDGRSMSALGEGERRRLGVEGIYLNPAHPGARTWIARIAREVAERYAVDGIHLDYIRLPGTEVGFDAVTRAGFAVESGVDPARPWTVAAQRRAWLDSAWAAYRARPVTAMVREVRDSLATLRAGIPLSAAVVADTVTAERHRGQLWRRWVREGLLDRAFLMSYAPEVQTVMDQLVAFAAEAGTSGRIVPGIAVYNTTAPTAAAKIKGARALGYSTVALYSYDSLAERPYFWPVLHALLVSDGSRP
jgi:uncharacterized lipoprotein YddW (UPF0748 family)